MPGEYHKPTIVIAKLAPGDTSYAEDTSEFCSSNYGCIYSLNGDERHRFLSREQVFQPGPHFLINKRADFYRYKPVEKNTTVKYMLVRVFVMKYLMSNSEQRKKNFVEFLRLDPDHGTSTVYIRESDAEDSFEMLEEPVADE